VLFLLRAFPTVGAHKRSGWEFRRNHLNRHVRFSPQLGKSFREINAARASNAHNHQRLDARRGKAARICISHARVARALSGNAWL
jgi:hypothetical protein